MYPRASQIPEEEKFVNSSRDGLSQAVMPLGSVNYSREDINFKNEVTETDDRLASANQ